MKNSRAVSHFLSFNAMFPRSKRNLSGSTVPGGTSPCEAFVHAQILARSRDATQRALAGATERIVTLAFEGVGHVTTADAHLAASAAARAREQRLAARLEREMAIQTGGGR